MTPQRSSRLGYTFGRYVPKTGAKAEGHSLKLGKDKSGLELSAKLLESSDEDVPAEPMPMEHDWISRLDSSVSEGILSPEEMKILGSYKGEITSSKPRFETSSRVTEEEKKLLRKSRQ